ncbi:polymorphic toxin-type HINT domain-containing protein [Risungbinella massiliensis]|uniref:polymorphic toxin-type HINT domain-containing protein n=1 Tax=Risungbinella massiliensis TaxID=1329796 RepID=UPI0005CBD010|nr:polymorphic toxin-type HINT domain-containing protein [Risungbinella massiliensis]
MLLLYTEGDPINNIDPEGHAASWWNKFKKGAKKVGKAVYNFTIGDSIRTIKNPNSKWYEKVIAVAEILPQGKIIKGVKALSKIYKATKKAKKGTKSKKASSSGSVKKQQKTKVSNQQAKQVKQQAKWGTKKTSKVPKRSKKPKASAKRSNTKSTNKTKPKQKITCKCFTINTKVLTKDGQKKIQDLKIGDKVLAKDEKTGKQAYKAVQWLFEKKVKEVYKLYIGKEVIETTGEHPFWIQGKGWVQAKDLKSGDEVEDDEGKILVIWNIEREKKETTVYNI